MKHILKHSKQSGIRRKKIAVLGGGTGTFVVLSGLKKYPVDVTAIVSMADDGGSTGRLRDDYGVLPPGDIRKCLVALSEASETMRELFDYRFTCGGFSGHSFGNIFLSAIETMTGDFNRAMEIATEVLKVRGRVVPVTLDNVHLRVKLGNGTMLCGESVIDASGCVSRLGVSAVTYDTKARANPRALQAIREADLLVVGPGSFYESVVPHFLVQGVRSAVCRAKAKRVFVINVMNKNGQMDGWSAGDHVRNIESFVAPGAFDVVLANNAYPSNSQLAQYKNEGEPVHVTDEDRIMLAERLVCAKLLASRISPKTKGDTYRKTLIRHDPDKLAETIFGLL